ncbi:zinc-binding dehydrogenase [uncultured Williamsia sp.]|uniref:zinc-binding dehydrogenase n=1 Tax=uncultured Williamsia sp. TaxID=259311 RepID=UPI00262B4B4C|nr:zinc-binding dehydrogenase [uncultured Williamsia sp.]
MRAAVLSEFGAPLSIQTLPDPEVGTGEVVVDIIAAGVGGYAADVFSGARGYLLELPVVPGPGGIGRIRATSPDSTRLTPGDWVYCDATIRGRDNIAEPDMILLGWTGRTPSALPLHRYFHHGSFAEQVLMPTENVTPIGEINPTDAGRWSVMGRLLVPYGGLLAGGLHAGQTLVINGATGGFGSAGVTVALAMGAGRVVATGRNTETLQALADCHRSRVAPVQMTGDPTVDHDRIIEAAGGPVDCVLDLLPRMATAEQVLTAAMTVRPGGTIVLMGGVGRTGSDELALPYRWLVRNDVTVRGKWMYPRTAIPQMVQLIRSGLIDLSQFDTTEFALENINDALPYAKSHSQPHQLTVIRPDRE